MKQIIIFILLAVQLGAADQLGAAEPLLYLTWKNDPASTMYIQWIASDAQKNNTISYKARKKSAKKWTHHQASVISLPAKKKAKLYRIELTGLHPDTIYEFRIGKSKKSFAFHTMPHSFDKLKTHLRFIVGGDAFNSSKERFQKMNRQAAKQNPRFAIIGGDIAYAVPEGAKSKQEDYKKWCEFFRYWMHDMVDKDGCLIPLFVAVGNHEVRGGFWKKPSNAPLFYTIFERGYYDMAFGNFAHFTFLDSCHTNQVRGDQTDWLMRTLRQANRKKFLHRFATYHVGAYPSTGSFDGGISRDVRKHWVPLFERYNIDACFESHDHAYKRTHPLIEGMKNPEGIVYFGDGSWGVKPRKPKKKLPYIASAKAAQQILVVDLTQKSRKFKALDASGKVIDRYEQKVIIP